MAFTTYKNHYASLISLGIPIVIGQIGIVLVGLADNIMVGRYATEHLAAASFVNSVFNIPIFFGLGFAFGLTALVGQAFGRGDKLQIGALLRNALLCNFIIGLLMCVAMGVMYYNVEGMGQPAELIQFIKPYFLLQLASLPFVMLFNAFKQFSDGINDTKTPMYIMLTANVLNIVGNYFLIYGAGPIPAMGVMGAGISTLASRIFLVIAFAILFFMRKDYNEYAQAFKQSTLNKASFLSLNKLGWMIGIQMGMETALFSITGVMVGWLGTIALASHQIIVSISTVGFMVYYGVGSAIAVKASNYYGCNDTRNVRNVTYAGFHIILALLITAATFFVTMRYSLPHLFTTEPAVIQTVAGVLIILAISQFGDGLQIAFANALRGLGDVTYMAVISFIGYFVIALPVSYLCAFVFDWGLAGIWSGYPVGLTLTGIALWARFHFLTKQRLRASQLSGDVAVPFVAGSKTDGVNA
ncbi:MAG: MATE family efflux transporter [Marinifilaceae bacterium]